MVFTPRPLHIPSLTTNYSAENQAFSNLGQTLGSLPGDIRKEQQNQLKLQQNQLKLQQEQKMRDEYARIGKAVADGTVNNRAAAGTFMGLGDIGTGFNFLKLDEAAKDRAADADLVRGLGIGGPASPVSANTPQNLVPLFTQAQAKYGLPEGYLPRVAQIESSNNPNAQNPNSSAGGLFQFIDSTARNYGLTNKFDPAAATDAAARLAVDNKNALTQALGREPTAGELYLAHQQGAGGASRLLANPNARAVDVVGERAVSLNGGNPNMTAGEFASKWTNKVDGRSAPTAQAGPQAGAPVADVPAQGAANAEFVIPGTNTTVDQQTLSSNPRIQNMVRALGAARTDAAKSTIGKMLELEIADAKQRQAVNAPTDVQRNYAMAQRDPAFRDFLKEQRAQTNVTVDQRGETEEAKAIGQAAGKRAGEMMASAASGTKQLQRIGQLESLLKNVESGRLQPGRMSMAALGKSLGVNEDFLRGIGLDPSKVGDAQAVNAITGRMVVDMIGSGGFPANNFSDADRAFITGTVASLANDPRGNEIILEAGRRTAQIDIDKAKAWREWRKDNKGGSFDDFEVQWGEKLASQDRFADLAKKAEAILGPKAPASGGWQDLGGGIRIREKR